MVVITVRTWQTTAEFVAHHFQGDAKTKKDLQKLVKACYNIDVGREDNQVYPEYVPCTNAPH